MRLPGFLAKPIFHVVYSYMRRKEGAAIPPIRRKVMLLDDARKRAFDALLDAALVGNPRLPIYYNLPYPKAEFLNYVCDWRGFVLHGSPLHDLETLERKSRDATWNFVLTSGILIGFQAGLLWSFLVWIAYEAAR